MEKAQKIYSAWREETLPPELARELENIEEKDDEIEDRFCREITFGTSGIRGRMGAGTNRINEIVVRRATRGVSEDLLSRIERPAVAVSYDTRKNSREYADITAETFAAQGVDVYIMPQPEPVPLLSFAVRALGLDGGVMITASHNPKEFNGYKVYNGDGSQIDEKEAAIIEDCIGRQPYFDDDSCPHGTEVCRAGQIKTVPRRIADEYRDNISGRAIWWTDDMNERKDAAAGLKVVYTPLNGTGRDHVTEILRRLGLQQVNMVSGQTVWDGRFGTCPSPNPENSEAFNEALRQYGRDEADIIIATDPDCDRMGVMAYDGDVYVHLSGNQAGVLMLDYLCSCLTRMYGSEYLKGKYVCKSIVTTPLAEKIAEAFGMHTENTLTGFKNIAAKIEDMCRNGREDEFLFGFEESAGYLYGTYTRDKDGVMAAQLICLAAAKCRAGGSNLLRRLGELEKEYGYIAERSMSLYFDMEKDRQTMDWLMDGLFDGELSQAAGQKLSQDRTYCSERVFQGNIAAPDGRTHRLIVRPSGTELKLKTYVFAEGSDRQSAAAAADAIVEETEAYYDEKLR